MSNTARLYQIDQLLSARKFVTKQTLLTELGVSPATLKRDLAFLRDRLNAPIVFDRDLGGYRFEKSVDGMGPQYELPGLWFSAEEIHALMTMHHLLSNLDSGGLIGPQVKPLLARLAGLLGSADDPAEEVQRRVHIRAHGARRFQLDHFQQVGSALLRRKRMQIRYHARGTDEETLREISPQRLVYYRDNWYLDAWCHMREDLRAFAVDAIQAVEILEKTAREVSEDRLDEALGAGYGIFGGAAVKWATLRFSPARARWVSAERWHPEQRGRFLDDGCYELEVPYADDRELMMDVMRYGADCEVLQPAEFRQKVCEEYRRAAGKHA